MLCPLHGDRVTYSVLKLHYCTRTLGTWSIIKTSARGPKQQLTITYSRSFKYQSRHRLHRAVFRGHSDKYPEPLSSRRGAFSSPSNISYQ